MVAGEWVPPLKIKVTTGKPKKVRNKKKRPKGGVLHKQTK